MGDVFVAIWSRRQTDRAPIKCEGAYLGDELCLDGLHVFRGGMPDIEFLPSAVLLRLDPEPTERWRSSPPRGVIVIWFVDPARPHLSDHGLSLLMFSHHRLLTT